MIGLVARSQRRYGGYIVHVGMVLVFLGFAGPGLQAGGAGAPRSGPGRSTVGRFTVRHDALRVTSDAQKQMVTGHVTVLRRRQGPRPAAAGAMVLQQARGRADDRGGDSPRGRRGPLRRAGRLRRLDADGDLRRHDQPAGGLDLGWLRRHRARDRARAAARDRRSASRPRACPPGPRPRRRCCCSWRWRCRFARAQGTESVQAVQRSALERQLEGEILCTCGCRRSLANCGMPNCEGHAAQTEKLHQYMKEGKDHDAIVAAFIQRFGGEDILSAPARQGLQPAGLAASVPDWRDGRGDGRLRGVQVVPAAERIRRPTRSRRRVPPTAALLAKTGR